MAALDGMRVLDLTQWEAGPTCTQYLAWMGADVVKVEPLRGEPGRRAFASGDGDSQYFMNHNGNKRAIAVDLKTDSGRRIMQQLVPRFDVLVENQGPGVVERLGLGPDDLLELNERLVYVRIKGYGLSGPYRDYKSFDPLAQAAAGVFSMTGTPDSPPLPPGGTFADTGTGIHSAFAVCAAFVQQQRTGRGQVIEVSMHEVMTMFIRTNASMNWGPGAAPTPRRPADGWPPSGLYRCKGDGPNDWVSVVIANRGMADAFFDAVGRSELLEDARFSSTQARTEHVSELRAELEPWFAARTNTEVMDTLGRAGVPCAATLDTSQVFADPHLVARDFFVHLAHPVHGEVMVMRPPFVLEGATVPMTRAPLVGEHTREVLGAELGLDSDELDALTAEAVIC
jgi:formyl-CoA transferase